MRNLFCVSFLSLVLGCTGPGLLAEDAPQPDQRIVAIGDLHGDYTNFVKVLEAAGIIDRRENWQAGDTHLVQLGDVPDRGPDTGKIIELLRKLERQAERDGGMVHVLIGNHEAMNMLGDLRYVDPGEYAAFIDRRSAELRDRYYEVDLQYRRENQPGFEPGPDYREEWNSRIPLGYVEHRVAWAPEGEIGSWILGHDAILRIGRSLFVHGGIGPLLLGMPVDEINAAVLAELRLGESAPADNQGMASAEDGPLWYRGLATEGDDAAPESHVDAILEFYDVDRIVVGHTPGLGTIVPRYQGKVLVIDSGISSYYGGYLASLTIEQEKLYNTQGTTRLQLPETGADPLPYLQSVLDLEPGMEALRRYIEQLATSRQ